MGGLGTVGLFGAVAVAAALAWYAHDLEIDTRSVPAERVAPVAAEKRATAAVTPAAKPLADFRATLERPLFEPTRRPRPVALDAAASSAGASEPAPSTEGLRIVGIMAGRGAAARALVRSAGQPVAIWVENGATIDGWKVAAIGERTVTLEGRGVRHELDLFETPAEIPATRRP